ncbi:MAG: orotate phosphoribosyltransferase [Proteobacteria bacterium]|nr:orotate phosphoribosyltransferase [Pseudomonadota bacterium]
MTGASVAQMRARLRDIIEARSVRHGTFTLASGATSTTYYNLKETVLDPEASLLIADLVLDAIKDAPPRYIGGLEMGAVPMAACVGLRGEQTGVGVRPFYVRKAAKEHGTRSRIEIDLEAGATAVILEDVTTTGGSALQAAAAVRAAGCDVDTVITVLDRQEGAAERLEAEGLRLVPLLTAADFA